MYRKIPKRFPTNDLKSAENCFKLCRKMFRKMFQKMNKKKKENRFETKAKQESDLLEESAFASYPKFSSIEIN